MSTGNFMDKLGMEPTGEIKENHDHVTIQNLKKNLGDCRNELRNCRANNNNLIKQLELMGSAGGRKRKKTRRKVPLSIIFGTKLSKKDRLKKFKALKQHQKTKRKKTKRTKRKRGSGAGLAYYFVERSKSRK